MQSKKISNTIRQVNNTKSNFGFNGIGEVPQSGYKKEPPRKEKNLEIKSGDFMSNFDKVDSKFCPDINCDFNIGTK